jgi:hypothetical protein
MRNNYTFWVLSLLVPACLRRGICAKRLEFRLLYCGVKCQNQLWTYSDAAFTGLPILRRS